MNYPEGHRAQGAEMGRAAAREYDSLSDVGQMAWARSFARELARVESDDLQESEMVMETISILAATLLAEFAKVSNALPLGA
jgi:hypothetical protein